MKVSEVPEIYNAIKTTIENDDSFHKELLALYEGIVESDVSELVNAKSSRIVDFLSEDARIPINRSSDDETRWLTIIPIGITLLLCTGCTPK